MTTFLAVLLGWESATLYKILGIVVALLGAAFMVLTSPSEFGVMNVGDTGDHSLLGGVMFFINCAGTACYVIFSRILLRKGFPSLTVCGWSYCCASLQMTCVAVAINSSPAAVKFVCPPENADDDEPSCGAWNVPTSAILPLAYWITFNSILVYQLITWANQFAPPSAVLGYTGVHSNTPAHTPAHMVKCSRAHTLSTNQHINKH